MGEKKNVYKLLVGEPEGKRSLGRPRHMWVDNIKMHLVETGFGCLDWIGLGQERYSCRAVVNAVMDLWVPSNAGKLLSGCRTGGLSSAAQLHKVSTESV
jgi:hypothetical protein